MSESVQPYRPLLLLGRGGMGSVEAAAEELPDGTTRVVALKRILRAGAIATDAPRVEMFLRESRLTTLLEHKNVIRSLAYGETDGELFLAMEYVAGEPLSRVLAAVADAPDRNARLPLPVLAYILAEACEGLHAAHQLRGPDGEPLGVVHRDVSPQNVMVGYDGSVKLLDFGVAKIDLLDCAARTKTGEVKGKTAYMSPEQAMGEAIDARSDLYSLGAVLFECVTGRRMWGSGTDLDVLRKLALEEPPRLVDVAPDTPAALDALFSRLVARDRATRPDTALEVATALRAFAEAASGEPTGDAASVEAAMSRLFPGESGRREAAITSALTGGPKPTSLSVGATGDSGDSGPVFVTHHGAPARASGSRAAAWLASGAAAVALFAVVGVAIHGRSSSEANAASPSATPPGKAEAPPSPPVQGSVAPTSLPSPAAIPTAPEPALATPPKAVVVRHVASPRPGRNVAPSLRTPPKPAPSAAPAPPRAPEPPDVDPTPF